MPPTLLRAATVADRPIIERLWLMFCHDMSEFQDVLPSPDGTFRSERLMAAFQYADWSAYLLLHEERPVGFAIVRGLTGPKRILNSFFVVRGVRRVGVGLDAVRRLMELHPGPWEVAFQDTNVPAVHFWRRVAQVVAGQAWAEERRSVPGRPELPPDVWISFDTRHE